QTTRCYKIVAGVSTPNAKTASKQRRKHLRRCLFSQVVYLQQRAAAATSSVERRTDGLFRVLFSLPATGATRKRPPFDVRHCGSLTMQMLIRSAFTPVNSVEKSFDSVSTLFSAWPPWTGDWRGVEDPFSPKPGQPPSDSMRKSRPANR